MHNRNSLLAALVLVSSLSSATVSAQLGAQLGVPPDPPENPSTPEKAVLGKALFWDEQLSSTGTVACGTCHFPEHGGGDPRTAMMRPESVHPGPDGLFGNDDDVFGSPGVIRHGANGHFVASSEFDLEVQVTNRKAPSVINSGFMTKLFWDGRAGPVFTPPGSTVPLLTANAALENQALEPPLSDVEMGHLDIGWPAVVQRLQNAVPLALASDIPDALAASISGKSYPELFLAAFGSNAITPEGIAMALATYQRTLVSDQAEIFTRTLTEKENRGAFLFERGLPSGGARCQFCHTGNLRTDQSFRNIGLRPPSEDPGAGAGKFRMPSLLNASLRAPFFHNGSKATLVEVVEFYARGGDFVDGLDPDIQPLVLSAQDKIDLIAYVETFTDPRVRDRLPPFDRPTLAAEAARIPVSFGEGTAGTGGFVPEAIANEPQLSGNPNFTVGVKHGLGGANAYLWIDPVLIRGGMISQGVKYYLSQTPMLVLPAGPLQTQTPGTGYGAVNVSLGSSMIIDTTYIGQWFVMDPGGPSGIAASNPFSFTVY